MLPVLDESNDHQRNLSEILNSKIVHCDENFFIYSIKEQKCNLVFPAKLEAAVRDGDVRDVMFAKTNDSILLCMNKGRSVSLDLKDYEIKRNLFEGEGPNYSVTFAREKEEISAHQNELKRGKYKLRKTKATDSCICVMEGIKSTTIDDDSQPTSIDKIKISNQINIENSDCIEQKHSTTRASNTLDKNVVLDYTKLCESIPNQNEIFKIMQNYSKGKVVHDNSQISSLSINIGTDETPRNVSIFGCIVSLSDGDVFVAGRTVYNENGSSIFEPGIYVQSKKSGPIFIPGQVMYSEEEGKHKTVFMQKKKSFEFLKNIKHVFFYFSFLGEERFYPGQIIDCGDGIPRFVPGKISEFDEEVTFIPAQIVQTDQG